MLSDADRIFSDLYGMDGRSLADVRRRGHWDGTAGLIAKGRDWIISQIKESGLRGRGGGRLPDRTQMELHAEPVRWTAPLSGDQCR